MCPNLNFSKKSFFIPFPCKRTYKEIQYLHQPLPKAFTVSLGVDGGVVVSGGTRIVVVLGFAALSDITPARLSSRLSTPSETSIQIVDRPKLLRTDQNSSSTSSSSVVLFSISFRQQLPGVSSHPLLCSSANAKRFTDPFLCSGRRHHVIKRIRFVCIVMGLLSPLLLAVSPGQT